MNIQNLSGKFLDKIINLKTKAEILPINMRKLVIYKLKTENQNIVQNNCDLNNVGGIISQDKMLNAATMRESMLLRNLSDVIPNEIIAIKAATKILPITMRKLYAYKVVSINKRMNLQKIIPIVLRKKIMYEKLLSS